MAASQCDLPHVVASTDSTSEKNWTFQTILIEGAQFLSYKHAKAESASYVRSHERFTMACLLNRTVLKQSREHRRRRREFLRDSLPKKYARFLQISLPYLNVPCPHPTPNPQNSTFQSPCSRQYFDLQKLDTNAKRPLRGLSSNESTREWGSFKINSAWPGSPSPSYFSNAAKCRYQFSNVAWRHFRRPVGEYPPATHTHTPNVATSECHHLKTSLPQNAATANVATLNVLTSKCRHAMCYCRHMKYCFYNIPLS